MQNMTGYGDRTSLCDEVVLGAAHSNDTLSVLRQLIHLLLFSPMLNILPQHLP
jgi:hypothetical protein